MHIQVVCYTERTRTHLLLDANYVLEESSRTINPAPFFPSLFRYEYICR